MNSELEIRERLAQSTDEQMVFATRFEGVDKHSTITLEWVLGDE